MKKQLHLILSIIFVMLVGLDVFGQNVGDQFTVGDLHYEIFHINSSGFGIVKVIDYTGSGGDLEIPISVKSPQNKTYSVNRIGDGAFDALGQDNKLTSVKMHYGIGSIGNNAFRSNNLTNVEIPYTVRSIGDFAFFGNQLTSVTMHRQSYLEEIKRNAFRDNKLTSIQIPNKVKLIGTFAFRKNQLNSITWGVSVNHIGYGAFRFNNLRSVVIPNTVTDIGGEAFANNPIIKVIPQGIATVPTIVTNHTFSERHKIDVFVHQGKVQAYKAAGWKGFKSIIEVAEHIGDTFIDNYIKYRVTSVNPNMVKVTDYNTDGGSSVIIPMTVNSGLPTYIVTGIDDRAFSGDQLSHVTIPSSVISIGESAFYNNKLASVIIPNSVISIGKAAFFNNILTSVTIPNSVISVETLAFRNNNLTSVTFGESLENIGGLAFHINPELVTIVVEAIVPPELEEFALINRDQIDLIVPAGTKEAYLDNGWSGFKSISEVAEVGIAFANNNMVYEPLNQWFDFESVTDATTMLTAEEINKSHFLIYPNPTKDKLYIDLGEKQELKQINIYSIAGDYLYSENQLEINTERLPNGTYLFEIKTRTGVRVLRKIIISH